MNEKQSGTQINSQHPVDVQIAANVFQSVQDLDTRLAQISRLPVDEQRQICGSVKTSMERLLGVYKHLERCIPQEEDESTTDSEPAGA